MLQVIDHGEIRELRLDRPPANALNTPLVQALLAGLAAAVRDGARSIVISGRDGMFSGGLDVPELLELPRPAMAEFWSEFFALTRALADCPVPVAAAITGHCPAGGAVLAVHCDYRIAALGHWKIGFNEVGVGLPVPSTILMALTELVGQRVARRLVTFGLLVEMDEALSLGLVDELVAGETVVERALEWCCQLNELPPIAMNQTRRLIKAPLLAALRNADDAQVATDYWFSEETQAAMRRLVARLRGG